MHQTDPEVVQKLNMILVNQNQIIEQQKSFAQKFMRASDSNVEQKLERLAERQNDMMEKLDIFGQRLSILSVQIQDAVSKITTHRGDHVVSLADASTSDKTRLGIKPIDNLQGLEEFECVLSDPDDRHKLIEQYSILCSRSEGKGVNCAYKLLDVVFTRDFLCKCSWSGGSRGDAIKIALKGYKNILNFFFQMVFSWDRTYTMESNESFFKIVLKNSEQRKNNRNIRASTQRNRLNKKLKNQPRSLKQINVAETKKQSGQEKGNQINDQSEIESSNNVDELQKKHNIQNVNIIIKRHEPTEINNIEENNKPVRGPTKRIYPSIHGQAKIQKL